VKGVVLLLTGPMQSWGERAAFSERDTLSHPTRSGIIGMIAAALGHTKDVDLGWAHGLKVQVRADQPGYVMTDFHMVGGGYKPGTGMVTADGTPRKGKDGRPSGTITKRHYLADASFVVTVHHPDADLIDQITSALNAPRWPIFLGRKSCPPAHPVVLGTTTAAAVSVLSALPAYGTVAPPVDRGALAPAGETDWFAEYASSTGAPAPGPTRHCMLYLDAADYGQISTRTVLRDNPTSFHPNRRNYTAREVATTRVTVPAAPNGVNGWSALKTALASIR
jgi:CRISPR system Cascade subunit CasD